MSNAALDDGNNNAAMIDRIMRPPEVADITALNKQTLIRLAHSGSFPPPVRLGNRAIGWRQSDVQKWIANLTPAV